MNKLFEKDDIRFFKIVGVTALVVIAGMLMVL